MNNLLACPCCSIPLVVTFAFGWIVVSKLIFMVANKISPANRNIKIILSITSWISVVFIGLLAIAIGILKTNPDLQARFFAAFCTRMTKSPNFDSIRCGLLKDISGKVLEIGPGPGTNFRCMNNDITEWVGVEPNNYFHQTSLEERVKYNLTFKASSVWLKGEDINIEAESFDYVIGTHVLCTVDDVDMVLSQVARALKPGGTYYFLEHVSASDGTFLRYLQILTSPLFDIFGNGCQFRRLWENIDSQYMKDRFSVSWEHFSASLPLPPITPHIRGKAVKQA